MDSILFQANNSYILNSQKKMKRSEHIAMYFFVFLSLFDQTREALPLSSFLMALYALLRDGLIFYLIFQNAKKFKIESYINFVLIFMLLLLLIISIVTSILNTTNILSVLKVFWLYCKSFLIYIIFFCYFKNNRYNRMLKFVVTLGVLLFIVNVVSVLFFSTLLTRLLSGGLRLTIGNSSIISYLYFTLFIIVSNYRVYNGKFINHLLSIIFFCAIISTVTTTAFIGLIVYFLVSFFFSNYKFKIKSFLYIFVFILLTLLSIESLNKKINERSFFSYVLDKGTQVTELISSKGDVTKVGTLSIREKQKIDIMNNMHRYDYVLGLGILGHKKYSGYLENTYYVLLFDFGILGVLVFFVILTKVIGNAWFSRNYSLISIIMVFLCYCYTLDFFLPYLTSFSFAFLLALNLNTVEGKISLTKKEF